MPAADIVLLPFPRRLSHDGNWVKVPDSGQVLLIGGEERSAIRLRQGLDVSEQWVVTCAQRAEAFITIVCDSEFGARESFEIDVTHNGIRVRTGDDAGAYYGAVTVRQLLRQRLGWVPTCRIWDTPDFPIRGATMDVSRDKIPKMETLFGWVDRLAEWKINQVFLYTEQTFAYEGHETVWKDADPLTRAEIVELDAYCRHRFIELVPNQNSFGHFRRFLNHSEYRHLAEAPDGYALSRGRWSPHP